MTLAFPSFVKYKIHFSHLRVECWMGAVVVVAATNRMHS